ncbi:MAG: P-II family nitrogen regulator [Nitrospinae bacterium]|nr:P-II family nitrogen regulator [Nitrospinota bacterium]MBF0633418.1 P-II family nitrogen regulator [Nitrospinota bacterium]
MKDAFNEKKITALTDVALITCVVQRGMADEVIKAARDAGAQGSTVFYARGYGVRERLGLLGVAVDVEKEVVNIVVSTDQANRIFEKMSVAAKMDTPGMGFMYMTHLDKAVTYIPPEVLEKLQPKC